MKKSILSALLFASLNAQAADIQNIGDWSKAEPSVIFGCSSYHLDKLAHKYLNESNPSIGFEVWDIQSIYVSSNSWGEKSLYLTYAPDYAINEYISVSTQVGIATGYYCSNKIELENDTYRNNNSCSGNGVIPMTAITLTIKPTGKNFGLSVSATPSAVMFSASYAL